MVPEVLRQRWHQRHTPRTHWVEQDEIVYVQAKRQYTEVHCKRRVLRTHALLKDVLKKLGNTVVRVRRSYAVNPRYIHSLRGEMLYLTTDEKIPVPARRIKEIRDLLSDTLWALGRARQNLGHLKLQLVGKA